MLPSVVYNLETEKRRATLAEAPWTALMQLCFGVTLPEAVIEDLSWEPSPRNPYPFGAVNTDEERPE